MTTCPGDGFVLTYQSEDKMTERWDYHGVDWYDAPIPRRFHRCRVQTDGWVDFTHIQRCACGAIRIYDSGWSDRNSRRKS